MPETIKLEDGTEREVPTEDEYKDLTEKAQQVETVQEELNNTKNELSKLQNKDFNFKKLRDLTEEQRSKLSDYERTLMEQQEKQQEELEQQKKMVVDSWKSEALAEVAGSDEETKQKVMAAYDRLKDDANDRESIKKKMDDAAKIAGVNTLQDYNPITAANSAGTGGGQPGKVEPQGKPIDKDFASKFGVTEEDINKYNT